MTLPQNLSDCWYELGEARYEIERHHKYILELEAALHRVIELTNCIGMHMYLEDMAAINEDVLNITLKAKGALNAPARTTVSRPTESTGRDSDGNGDEGRDS